MPKMKMKHVSLIMDEAFEDFINSKAAAGLAEKTVVKQVCGVAIGRYLSFKVLKTKIICGQT